MCGSEVERPDVSGERQRRRDDGTALAIEGSTNLRPITEVPSGDFSRSTSPDKYAQRSGEDPSHRGAFTLRTETSLSRETTTHSYEPGLGGQLEHLDWPDRHTNSALCAVALMPCPGALNQLNPADTPSHCSYHHYAASSNSSLLPPTLSPPSFSRESERSARRVGMSGF
jgi:hypothetical protein